MNLRTHLGFCPDCWRRWRQELILTALDDEGTALSSSTLRLCNKHARSAIRAAIPVADEVKLTYDSGVVVTYSDPVRGSQDQGTTT